MSDVSRGYYNTIVFQGLCCAVPALSIAVCFSVKILGNCMYVCEIRIPEVMSLPGIVQRDQSLPEIGSPGSSNIGTPGVAFGVH